MKINNREIWTIENFAEMVIKYRWIVLTFSMVLAVIMGSGVKKLVFNNDQDVFFADDNPQLMAMHDFESKYSKDKNVFIIIEAENKNIFTKTTLSAIEELVQESWKTPFSSRVDAITNFQYTHSVDDDLMVEDLIFDAGSMTDAEINRSKKIALNEPMLVNRLINEDASVTGINITVNMTENEIGEAAKKEAEVSEFVREIVADFEQVHPQLKLRLSGLVMLSGAFKESAKKDGQTLIPIMFLLLIATVWFTTRSISALISTTLILIFSVIAALGMAGWLGLQLNVLSASAPTMIITLAIADSIHIIVTVLQLMKKGCEKITAIKKSIVSNFAPVFITSLTTVVGFMAMRLNDSPAFHSLGAIAAIGISATFLFSISTLPVLLSILPIKITQGDISKNQKGMIERMAFFVIKYSKKIAWAFILLLLVLTPLSISSDFNDQWVEYFDTSIPFRSHTDYMTENLTGIYTIEFSMNSGESQGIHSHAYLQKLEAFETWLKNQKGVLHINSFSEVMRKINKSMHGDDTAYYAIPSTRNEAAQFLLMYEMSLPFGLDLNNRIITDKSETRFTITVENLSSTELILLTESAEHWLKENTPEMFNYGISRPLMFAHLGTAQINGMFKSGLFALILVTIILMFAFKSVRFGLLSIIPNMAPIILSFGIWAIIIGEVNSAVAVVIGMTLGIIVDDTVHFLSKYLHALRNEKKNNNDAIQSAFHGVGRAIIITTFVLCAGFSILAFSSFAMNSDMAKITVLTIFLALITDLFLLPALLLVRKEGQE